MQIDETDTQDIAETARREMDAAKAKLSDAAGRMRDEARNAGGTIQTLVMDELDRRAAGLGQGMRSLAERMREAAEPEEEGTVAPRMMGQAVDMIEDLSYRLEGSSAREIGDKLSRFGRENPVTFMAACLATGVLAGRFLIATTDDTDTAGTGTYRGYDEGMDGADRASEYGNYRTGRTTGDFGYGETDRSGLDEETGSEFRSGFYDTSEDRTQSADVETAVDWEGHDTPDSDVDGTTGDLSRPGYVPDNQREGKTDV